MRVWMGVVIAVVSSAATAEAEERPVTVSAGVSAIVASDGDTTPFVMAQVVWRRWRGVAVAADFAFFTAGDRVFGPRSLTRLGVRAYVRGGLFVSGHGALFYQWDVDYPYSDASQAAGTSAGVGGGLGYEVGGQRGLVWMVEGGVLLLEHVDGSRLTSSGVHLHLGTALGWRF